MVYEFYLSNVLKSTTTTTKAAKADRKESEEKTQGLRCAGTSVAKETSFLIGLH